MLNLFDFSGLSVPISNIILLLKLVTMVQLSLGATNTSSILLQNGTQAAGSPPEQLEWWQQAVIYQIYPRSFKDSNGDGTGDLKGIQSKLDYLVELGIGAVWLSPIYKSPMKDFGYDISNFTDVDPIFGTLDDFKGLVEDLHKNGIKIIMDFIPNHSSDQHPWFQDSLKRIEPYTDYYTWKDPSGWNDTIPLPPNNWVSVFGGSMWEYDPGRRQFYLHQFTKEQPDLRLENPKVIRELLNAMEFWIELGVDGFRMDAVPHMFEDQTFPDELRSEEADPDSREDEYPYWEHKHTFNLPEVLISLAEFRKLLDNKTSQDGKARAMMTEGYVQPLEELMKYYGTKEIPIAHFPFNFELVGIATFNAQTLKTTIDNWMKVMPDGAWANWLVGNHDNSRVASKFGPELVDAINMIVLLLPGTAVTYYGEEIGMEDTFLTFEETVDTAGLIAGPDRYQLFSRDPERTPMQWDSTKNAGFSSSETTWLPLNSNYTAKNILLQSSEPESHLKVYQALVALRKTNEWKTGQLETKTFRNVFGFMRRNETDGFLVLANLDNKKSVKFDASIFDGVPSSGVVHVRSVGFTGPEKIGSVVRLSSLALQPSNSFVLTFSTDGSSNKNSAIQKHVISLMSILLICLTGFVIKIYFEN